ncbi:magnesium transporter [Histidinibacterium aquaticum]|uniref:Magnesium transporter MgtE n=1 Tax=Histidinibacterium aquaticum TaxID=2613962 RepID=A0A5J5GDX7_9RHOB|nr:magnesium transporter [Histidinibacterium aquaticum]KAA9005674.1 magnesium transporter [Histidinibacterium aquaticum]
MEAEEIHEPDEGSDAYALKPELFAELRAALEAGDAETIDRLMEPLHAADIADLLEQIEPWERRELIELWHGGLDGEILSEIEDNTREEILGYLSPEQLTLAVRELESDDVVDLVEYLDDKQQEAVLDYLEPLDRVAVETALSYPEESAGRLMQVETVRAPQHWSVGEMIDFLRAHPENLPEQFYHVILVDPRMKPVGNVTLGRIMSSKRSVKLWDIKEDIFVTIPATQDEGEVAYAFNQYHLISAPVVDEDGRLVGVVTIDDAMIVLSEENEEDLLLLAGVGENTVSDKVSATVRRRLPWLAVNLVTAILASLVIAIFEEAIAGYVALAVLMPIVASMGGNAGTQSLTVAVRAIATKDLTGSNVLRVIRRETMVGLINGAAFAIVMGIVGIVWFGSPMLGVVIAIAMVINLVVAGLAGTVIPVALEKMGVDPALASGTFVTTVTDVVGFFAFLGIGAAVLL